MKRAGEDMQQEQIRSEKPARDSCFCTPAALAFCSLTKYAKGDTDAVLIMRIKLATTMILATQ